ncbi:MAG: DNA-methyltransferase [Nitrososphaerales archaeon]
MNTFHKVIFGSCKDMHEVRDNSIHLVITSPPYYNAPYDYPNLFENYEGFLHLILDLAKELHRVVAKGRIVCFVTDDMLVEGVKYPIVSDITSIMRKEGFRYRDKIMWVKPKGYSRISRRSGLVVKHPYPMYFYPDNVQESILIFQKGKFDYQYMKTLPADVKKDSSIDLSEYNKKNWNLSVWNITNVLPYKNRLEVGIAAFPEEIPVRLIRLFSFKGETVLDPFLGSGTTSKVARDLGRSTIGYEIDPELKPIILRKLDHGGARGNKLRTLQRADVMTLRKSMLNRVNARKSVTKRKS